MVDDYDGLFSHYLNYYSSLGVSDFLLVNYTGKPLGVGVEMMAEKPFDVKRDVQYRNSLRHNYLAPGEWFILADVDEFHEASWIQNWKQIVSDEIDYVASDLVDCFASVQYNLPPLLQHPSIFEQYPFQCSFTRHVVRGYYDKVMLMRNGQYPITPGHHATTQKHQFTSRPYYLTGKTYHFKWRAGVLERLRDRRNLYRKLGYAFAEESQRVLDFFVGL